MLATISHPKEQCAFLTSRGVSCGGATAAPHVNLGIFLRKFAAATSPALAVVIAGRIRPPLTHSVIPGSMFMTKTKKCLCGGSQC